MTALKARALIEYLQLASEFLAARAVDSPRLDAELLLCDSLGLERVELYTNHDRPLSRLEVDCYRDLLRRRARGEPLAYIRGRREFHSLEFAVDRRVLVPRPETEVLVDKAAEILHAAYSQPGVQGRENNVAARPLQVADIGTGCGTVAVALAVELPALRVLATDISAAALEVAPGNAGRHAVADRIEFAQGDLFAPLGGREPFDLLVSNPPYCTEAEFAGLDREVRDWEPKGALVGGPEGMDVTRRLIEQAPAYLASDGWLLLEVGTQASLVVAMLKERHWRQVAVQPDLAGRDRVVAAQSPGS